MRSVSFVFILLIRAFPVYASFQHSILLAILDLQPPEHIINNRPAALCGSYRSKSTVNDLALHLIQSLAISNLRKARSSFVRVPSFTAIARPFVCPQNPRPCTNSIGNRVIQ
jgi:hypothetical protein